MEQSLVFAEGDRIEAGALPAFLKASTADDALAMPQGNMSLTEILEDLERQLIQRAYDQAGGVKTECARILGVKTSALYYKLEKYGIGVIASRGGPEAGPAAEGPAPEDMLGDGPPPGATSRAGKGEGDS